MRTLLLLAVALTVISGCANTREAFQSDADIIRLRHLEYYGNLIESYHQKTGFYPFQGAYTAPTYIFVAHEQQYPYTKPGPNYHHREVMFSELVNELEKVLEIQVEEKYDPQFVPVNKPNFYIYMITKDTYYFSVHVHQPFDFANKINRHYYKIEISNRYDNHPYIHNPSLLFEDQRYILEKNKSVLKPGFFQQRHEQYKHHTKVSRN